jgi:hypothetical protein
LIVNLYREIKKEGSLIIETFSISPRKKELISTSTRVTDFIVLLTQLHSIREHYPLIKVEFFDYIVRRTYTYLENKPIPERGFNFQFNYIPFKGEKKCKKCFYFRKKGRTEYCSGRHKKLKWDVWPNCLYWKENSIIKIN